MYRSTGKYLLQFDTDNIKKPLYYTFMPDLLMNNRLELLDTELSILLIKAHHELGILEGLSFSLPNFNNFMNILVLKEICYSFMIDEKKTSLFQVLGANNNDESILKYANILNNLPSGTFSDQSIFKIHQYLYEKTTNEIHSGYRKTQTFLTKAVAVNIETYNPTAPQNIDEVMKDLIQYINSEDITDILVKAAMVHYQFEIIHPFLNGNGVIGRILIQIMLKNDTLHFPFCPFISEYLFKNRVDYFDKLSFTQSTGDYLPWVKFLVNGIFIMCNLTISRLQKATSVINIDLEKIKCLNISKKPCIDVYLYFIKNLVSDIKSITEKLEVSYNTVAKVIDALIEIKILRQLNSQARHRLFGYVQLMDCFEIDFDI